MKAKQEAQSLLEMIDKIDDKIVILSKKRTEIKYRLYKQYPHYVDSNTMMKLEGM